MNVLNLQKQQYWGFNMKQQLDTVEEAKIKLYNYNLSKGTLSEDRVPTEYKTKVKTKYKYYSK